MGSASSSPLPPADPDPDPDPEDIGASAIAVRRRALLNPLVLENIAKRLPPADLLRLRLTSTAWNRAFIPELRRKHAPIEIELFGWGKSSQTQLKRYTDLMRDTNENPFGRYELHEVMVISDKSYFEEFFTLHGETITSLKLVWNGRHWIGGNIHKLDRAIFQLTPNLEDLSIKLRVGTLEPLASSGTATATETATGEIREIDASHIFRPLPNLKRLQLQLDWYYVDRNSHDDSWNKKNTCWKILIEELLRNATGLEEVHLEFGLENPWNSGTLPLLQTFDFLAPAFDKLKILTTQFAGEDDLKILEQLSSHKQSPLQLEKFTITFLERYSNEDRCLDTLHSFLVTQFSTLRHLDINVVPNGLLKGSDSCFVMRFPQMMELRTLVLDGAFQIPLWVRFEGGGGGSGSRAGSLGDAFPSLKSISINWKFTEQVDRFQKWDQLEHHGVTQLILKDVEVGSKWVSPDNGGRLDELGRRLPRVTRLEVNFERCQIPHCIKVCWPSLTVLCMEIRDGNSDLEPPLDLDEWLSGVPRSRFHALESEPGYLLVKTAAGSVGMDSPLGSEILRILRSLSHAFKTLPGISDLTCLRSFTLIVKGVESRLTDIGGYLGLAMSSSSLQQLVIRCSARQWGRLKWSPINSSECNAVIRLVLGPQAGVRVTKTVPVPPPEIGARLAKLGKFGMWLHKRNNQNQYR